MKKIIPVFLMLFFPIFSTLYAQVNNGIGDTLHAVHYNIHTTEINTGTQTIRGFTEIFLVPKVDSLATIPLDFMYLTADSVFVNGVSKSFTFQNNILRIFPGTVFTPQDTIKATVYYHGQPFHESWGGFHFSGDYAFNLGVGFQSIPHNLGKAWFPCVDNFTDRATYDVYTTVANSQKAVSGGLLIDTIPVTDSTTTWHWRMQHDIPTYLISVATGDYVRYSDTYYGIEDTIPIYIYTRPSEQNNVAGSFIHLKDILGFYETRFGSYPFDRVGYIGTAIGAMEHASNIAYPHFVINGTTSYEYLYAHELSHMWFGDEVTCASAEEMWLNEGWASFCEMYYKTGLYGEEVVKTEMRDRNQQVLERAHFTDNGYWALDSVPQQYTYGSTSYDKGAVVVNTLKNYLGDSLFFNAVTAWLQTYAWQSKSSADLRDFLTSYTGINMTPFFDAWVSTPGTPHFSIDSTTTVFNGTDYQTDIYLKQKYKGVDFLAGDNILEVTFVDNRLNMQTDTIHFSGLTGHSVKLTPFSPEAVLLDLNEKTNDATVDNYKIFSQTGSYKFPDTYFRIYIDSLTDSSLIQATHHYVAPDTLKNPVPGLRLSGSRYWSIAGVFENRVSARGRFYYNHSQYLDEDLIRSDNDSVVLLYRSSPDKDWEAIPQTREGIWSIGYIYTDELKSGEYTLAAWDLQTVGLRKSGKKKSDIRIFPNPAGKYLNIRTDKTREYTVNLYNTQSQLIDVIHFRGKQKRIMLPRSLSHNEVIFVALMNKGNLLTCRKIVVL